MTTQRDDLAVLIDKTINEEFSPGDDVMGAEIADAILAAGYTSPRTITTTEELDALGRGSAILSKFGVYVNDGDPDGEQWASLVEDYQGGPIWVSSEQITLPATVLHEGVGA